MSTAVECVREIFPESAIQTKRIDNPFRVTVTMQAADKQPPLKVWTCKQHNLFQRNPKRRRLAMDSMRGALARVKEQLSSGTQTAPNSPTSSTTSSLTTAAVQNNNPKPAPEKQASLVSL